MNRKYQMTLLSSLLLVTLAAGMARGTDLGLDWYTVDGGGGMHSSSASFTLSGTIGQPDANTAVMTGGDLEVTGGFWPGVTRNSAMCRGDLNCDGWIDFGDINPFVLALVDWPRWRLTFPDCPEENADVNGDGAYGGTNGFGDINPFIELLNSGGGQPVPCP